MTTNSVDWHGSKQAWSTFFFFFAASRLFFSTVSFKNEFVFAWLKILCVKWPVVWTVKAESLSELAELMEQHENNLPTRVFSFLHDPFDPWCEGAVCSATYRGHHFPTQCHSSMTWLYQTQWYVIGPHPSLLSLFRIDFCLSLTHIHILQRVMLWP